MTTTTTTAATGWTAWSRDSHCAPWHELLSRDTEEAALAAAIAVGAPGTLCILPAGHHLGETLPPRRRRL